jgi:hypothetical protein
LNQRGGRKPPAAQGGGSAYGLGLIGALVWYWRQAEEPSDYVAAVLKAVVWPAFLVNHAYEMLNGMNAGGVRNSD